MTEDGLNVVFGSGQVSDPRYKEGNDTQRQLLNRSREKK
jgi:hypothetical protein